MKTDFDLFLDRAFAAESKRIADVELDKAAAELSADFDSKFAEYLTRAYARRLPPAKTRKKYRSLFEGFRKFAENSGCRALPCHGSLAAGALIFYAAKGAKMPEIKELARAIEYA